MRRLSYVIVTMMMSLLCACDIHEWPEPAEYVKLHLKLNYETSMTEWNHLYDGISVVEQGLGNTYDNQQKQGVMRYVVRTYPIWGKQRAMHDYKQEFVRTKEVDDAGYGYNVTLDVLPGEYDIMVWSDLVETNGDEYFYNVDDFSEIILQGDTLSNSNYRDAFNGMNGITLHADKLMQGQDTINMTMRRSLAKFEIVANDLSEFIKKHGKDINQFKVVIQYVGFIANAYSLFTNKPVDSATGEMFESSLKELNSKEASLGFDYVFLSQKDSKVTIKIGIYKSDGTQVSMSKPIEVPLRLSHHTILKGNFLIQNTNTSEGINISPGFDGNHNIVL